MATGRRRGRAIFYIAFIVILLLVLVFVFTRMNPLAPQKTEVKQAAATQAPTQDTVEVYITTQKVLQGQVLSDDLIRAVSMPRAKLTKDLFFVKEGKEDAREALIKARARYDIEAGTPLTKGLLFTNENANVGSAVAFKIPAGKVAIAVPISKLSSVAYGLQKGDRVNIIVSLLLVDMDTNFQSVLPNRTGSVIAPGPISENQTYVTSLVQGPPGYETGGSGLTYLGRIEIDPTMNNPVYLLPSEPQRPRLVSQTLIQDVEILQMGNFSLTAEQAQAAPAANATPAPQQTGQPAPTKAPTAKPGQAQQAPSIPDVVTLIVSPQDAITLNYLMLAGANLNMVMRSAISAGEEEKSTEAVTLQFILDQYAIPNPAKLPYGVSTRMDTFPERVYPFPDPSNASTPAAK